MKYILLLIFIFNTHLLATSKIILGSYSSQSAANQIKLRLDTVIQNDDRFKKFLLKNSIKSFVEQDGKYFLVSLEPINDIVTQHAIINRVKKSNFKDAYAIKLKKTILIPEDDLLKEEPKIQDIQVNTPKKQLQNIVQPRTHHTPKYSSNLLDEYFNELIATIAILLLSIIYLSIKRKQQSRNAFANFAKRDLPDLEKKNLIDKNSKETPTIINETKSNNESNEVYELKKEGAIAFDALDDTEKDKPAYPKSNIIKKELAAHKNTTKADFRDFEGARIMIAEDNIINQKVINGLLSDSGLEIVIADDGQIALDILENDTNFCLILMDAHMPNIDGYQATKAIRANPKYAHITVIALSGDTAQDDIKKMKKIGMQEHLEKPLKMDPLYDIFNAYSYKKTEEKAQIIQELDAKKGLEFCGGDVDFYKEILGDFLKNYSDSNKYIKELLHSELYAPAQNLLLDISSLTANIGAKSVGQYASDLRVALDAPNKEEYDALFKNYAKHFDALELEVKSYL